MAYKSKCDGVAKKGKTKGTMMAGGGMVAMKKGGKAHSDKAMDKKVIAAAIKKHERKSKVHRAGLKEGGMVPMAPTKTVKMRKGGSC